MWRSSRRRSASAKAVGSNGPTPPEKDIDAQNNHSEVFTTGGFRVSTLISKSGFEDRVQGTEETDKEISKLEGYLYKESSKGKNRKKFFSVNNSYLNYYRNRNAYKQGRLKGSINLVHASTICILVRNGRPTRRFAIQTEGEDDNEEICVFLKAKSKQAARIWVECLNQRRAYWLDPSVSKSMPQTTSMLMNSPKRNLIELGDDDDEGWRDRIASDDEEDSDEGFASAKSHHSEAYEAREDGAIRSLAQRRAKAPTASAHSYSSNESGDDDSETEDVGGIRKSRSSSAFRLFSDQLPNDSRLLLLPYPPASRRFWRSPDHDGLRVRGPHYLETREKVPVAMEPLFDCVAVDVFVTDDKVEHVCAHPSNRIFQALQRKEKFPFTFVVNIQVPGPPYYSFVVYMVASNPEIVALLDPGTSPEFKLSDSFPPGMKQLLLTFFRTGDDNFRNTHFKLIPRVVEGPWVVRAGIPSKPALIGTKLRNSYYATSRYFELDVNVGTNSMVSSLTQLAASYAKLLTVDLAFLLEGKIHETLPEFIIGMVRCVHLDFRHAVPL